MLLLVLLLAEHAVCLLNLHTSQQNQQPAPAARLTVKVAVPELKCCLDRLCRLQLVGAQPNQGHALSCRQQHGGGLPHSCRLLLCCCCGCCGVGRATRCGAQPRSGASLATRTTERKCKGTSTGVGEGGEGGDVGEGAGCCVMGMGCVCGVLRAAPLLPRCCSRTHAASTTDSAPPSLARPPITAS